MTGHARAEKRGVFDDAPALLQHVAKELGDADEAGILKFNVDDRAAAVDAEATGVTRQLVPTGEPVQLRGEPRQPQPPERHVLDAAGPVIRRCGHEVDAGNEMWNQLAHQQRIEL